MSFQCDLHVIQDDPKCLVKTLISSGTGQTRVATANITFKEGHGIQKFVIKFRPPSGASTFREVNYIHNKGDNRYYIVDLVTVDPSNLITYECHLDVLMTYSEQLKVLSVTLDRSETIFNGYLPDGEYSALGYRAIVCKAFPDALDDDSYVLMTTG